MRKPKAVLISDVHFNINTLSIATSALVMAVNHAKDLGVPLIIAGDLNDTKAIIRGEVANRLIEILSQTEGVRILVGNHDLLNEKSKEHSLHFLSPYVEVIDHPVFDDGLGLYFIPYCSDPVEFLKEISSTANDYTIIAHQGFKGAAMGEYVIDKSSVDPAEVKHFRVITGHYHRHQTVGTVTYIGTPYTVTFAEAKDGPKGFQVLYTDGTLKQIPTNLRKHVIVERTFENAMDPIEGLRKEDLLWLKVSGPYSELEKLSKKKIGQTLLGHQNFKLDPIPDESERSIIKLETMTSDQIIDKMIDDAEETSAQKKYLKSLWREALNENR